MALGAVLGGLGGGAGGQPLLLGLAEVDGGLLDGGEDDEVVGVELLGEDLAGEVLVDDGGRALEVVPSVVNTGIPPPPQATTMWSLSTSARMVSSLMTAFGFGEATTRR